jgi:hypothetical protein
MFRYRLQWLLALLLLALAACAPPPPDTTEILVSETDIKYVSVKQDVTIFRGPGASYPTAGIIFKGGWAEVTGVSPDKEWWHIPCIDNTPDNCWISADPQRTEPMGGPGS